MSFNTEIGLWCIVLPATVAFLAALASLRLSTRKIESVGTEDATCRGGFVSPTVALGWWSGLAIALAARQWMAAEDVGWLMRLQGAEAWQTALWPLLLLAVVPSLANEQRTAVIRSVAAAVLASALAFVVMPSGDGWEDRMDLHRPWSTLIVTSIVLNSYLLDSLIRSGGRVWSLLVMIAWFGPAVLLTSLNYAAPAEWVLAGLAGTGGILLIAGWAALRLRDKGDEAVVAGLSVAITLPVAGLIATAVTTARFYTWEDYPAWLYAIALFLPAIITIIDLPLRRFSGKVRIPVAALTSVALIAVCVWKLILQEPPESW